MTGQLVVVPGVVVLEPYISDYLNRNYHLLGNKDRFIFLILCNSMSIQISLLQMELFYPI